MERSDITNMSECHPERSEGSLKEQLIMAKYLLNFLFTFLLLSSFSFAGYDNAQLQAKLQKEYGWDLTKAPFFLRFAYHKEFNKDWKETDYPQRFVFLADYEAKTAAQQAKEKADIVAAAAKEKERLRRKKDAERKEKEKLRAQLAKEKAEKKADEERQKKFDKIVREQQKILEQIRRDSTRKHAPGSAPMPDQMPDQSSNQGPGQGS